LDGRQNHKGLAPVRDIDKKLREWNEGRAGQPAKKRDGDDAAPVIILQLARHHREHRFIEHAGEHRTHGNPHGIELPEFSDLRPCQQQ
jgi:hypothetical protein